MLISLKAVKNPNQNHTKIISVLKKKFLTRASSVAVIATFIFSTQSVFANSKTASAPKTLPKKSKSENTANFAELDAMLAKYGTVRTLSAEFSQTIRNQTLGTNKVSSGQIFVKRPKFFRWQTTAPEPSILVSNGLKAWYYTPPFRDGESGQVLTRKTSDIQSQVAIDLLSGQATIKKEFKIRYLQDGAYDLTPVQRLADIERITLCIERSTKLVYKVTLYTNTGNETELTLKNVSLGTSLPDEMFNFKVPPNTEEIR